MAKKKNKKSNKSATENATETTAELNQAPDEALEVSAVPSLEAVAASIEEATEFSASIEQTTVTISEVDTQEFKSAVFDELTSLTTDESSDFSVSDSSTTSEVATLDASTELTADTSGESVNALLITDHTQIKQVLEATIFAAPKAMSTIRLRNLLNHFNYDSSQMNAVLDEMIVETADKGFQLIKVAGGYQFRSHPEHSEVLQKLLEDKPARLSASALEVLAIVAYKQPVSRGDIDSVRGVDSGHLMKGLLEKNLVRTLGHAETPGRPLLYGTTPYFLEVFSLGSLDDLPQMDELKRELAPASEGSEVEGGLNELGLLMGDESGLPLDSSGLAANPNRGSFDQPHEEETHAADFGMADRAREEVNTLAEAQQ